MNDTIETRVARARAALLAPLLALHPKTENPRHGCCAPPKLCDGHSPECRSFEHPLGGVPWPCRTLRAVGITSDADAAEVRRLADDSRRESGPHTDSRGTAYRHARALLDQTRQGGEASC